MFLTGSFQRLVEDDDSCLREVIAGEFGSSLAALVVAAVLLDGTQPYLSGHVCGISLACAWSCIMWV